MRSGSPLCRHGDRLPVISEPPAIPGRDDFGGRTFHTGRWPHEGVDFTGRRVAVIGTGSSGVQSIPLIAEQADQVIVFQRTPSYAVPAHNEPLDPEQVAAIKADYVEWRKTARTPAPASVAIWRAGPQRDGRVGGGARATYDARWEIGGLFFLGSFNDLLLNPESNATAASYVRERIAEIVDDPETAAMLSPDTTIG